MQVYHGKVHNYLGMKLYYIIVAQVKITMLDYTNEILDAFDKEDPRGGGTKSSAASAVIFDSKQDCDKLNVNQDVEFLRIVVKTLFSTKQSRPDICTSFSFFTTIVREPDKDN